jgi:hypothetical protein
MRELTLSIPRFAIAPPPHAPPELNLDIYYPVSLVSQ